MAQISVPSSTKILFLDNIENNEEKIKFEYRITNIVALGVLTLEKKVNFDKIEEIIDVRYLNRFPCILFKLLGVSIIIFKNGKMIITGLKNQEQIPKIREEIEKILHKAGVVYTDFTISIQNFVAMTNLNKRINLELTCLTLKNTIYEPEQFPAAIVRDDNVRGAFLIFSNSKIICLGIKDITDLEISMKNLIAQLYEYDLFFPSDSL